jgi:DNA (cytosine-5)-methyltransferase 1
MLENVPGLLCVNEGKDFALIMSMLRGCGYTVEGKVINACHFVPQNRRRLFILGVRGQTYDPWLSYSPCQDYSDLPLFSDGKKEKAVVKDCLEENVDPCFMLSDRAVDQAIKRKKAREANRNRMRGGYKIINDLDCSPTLITDIFNGRILLVEEKEKPPFHGFGKLIVANERDLAPTLLTNPDKGNLVVSEDRNTWRRLTPREYSRLMGFDEPQGYEFVIPVSKTKAYEQFGNAVVPQVAESIAWHIANRLFSLP